MTKQYKPKKQPSTSIGLLLVAAVAIINDKDWVFALWFPFCPLITVCFRPFFMCILIFWVISQSIITTHLLSTIPKKFHCLISNQGRLAQNSIQLEENMFQSDLLTVSLITESKKTAKKIFMPLTICCMSFYFFACRLAFIFRQQEKHVGKPLLVSIMWREAYKVEYLAQSRMSKSIEEAKLSSVVRLLLYLAQYTEKVIFKLRHMLGRGYYSLINSCTAKSNSLLFAFLLFSSTMQWVPSYCFW